MKIKHDFVHSNEPKPETWAEAILAGIACLSCILLASGYLYILSGIGGV